jgi:alpha-amylase/alpha-mannosidase (GH57 family)
LALNLPICLIWSLEEVFEEILEKVDTGGELNIDVAIILENEPRNVRNKELVFLLTTPVFKIPWVRQLKK